MNTSALGKVYQNGEIIVQQGEVGDCMYVIQSGEAEVLQELDGRAVCLAVLGNNDFFGEMSLFENQVRSATVRALGEVRVLTVDKKTVLRRIQEDPALAFRILEHLCHRLRKLDAEVAQLKNAPDLSVTD
jgi:CRP/FNR family transcriptional regulator, cyclic AMP receptor protein